MTTSMSMNTNMSMDMNMNMNTKYSCINCSKEYTRKSSLEKHKILCDYKYKTKREREIDSEELGDMPTHSQLVKIVQECIIKMNKMEEKMDQMKKWVGNKKRKVNVNNWLNTNINPTIGFLEWVNMSLKILPEHFENLMENSLFHTIQQVFEYNLREMEGFVYPICCFTEKLGIFYICDKKENNLSEWRQLVITDMVLILKTLQNRLIIELSRWKSDNQYKFDENDKIAIIFNKAIIKLMNMTFTQDATMSRIKNNLYMFLKTDIKMMIECELEF